MEEKNKNIEAGHDDLCNVYYDDEEAYYREKKNNKGLYEEINKYYDENFLDIIEEEKI